jgi:NADH-quinone oxidoreductase subunit N
VIPSDANLTTVLPEVIVALTAIIVVLLDLVVNRERRDYLGYVGVLGLVVAGAADAYIWSTGKSAQTAFNGTVIMDGFTLFTNMVFLAVGILVLLLSPDYLHRENINLGEYYVLVLAGICGMMLMGASSSLMTIFLALELFSICLYVLAGFARTRPRSQEAGLKYFLLSAFASAFLLYGMALVYGETGSTQLATINAFLTAHASTTDAVLLIGMGLMLVGLAFKMAAVPFHVWTPDVYEGSPGPVTAFMSVGTKLAAFAAFVRLFGAALPALVSRWEAVVWALAVATMVFGNVAAIVQTNVKRMLGYSSIAHAGYLLVAVASFGGAGVNSSAHGDALPSLLFYFAVYTFMNIGAFAVVMAVAQRGERNENLADFSGLASRSPWLAAAMAIFMFSLAGFPPTAGFLAKLYVFRAAVSAGHTELAVIGVLCSLMSVFYYLRVIYYMYMQPSTAGAPRPFTPPAWTVTLAISVAGSVLLGIFAGPLLQLVQHSPLAGG